MLFRSLNLDKQSKSYQLCKFLTFIEISVTSDFLQNISQNQVPQIYIFVELTALNMQVFESSKMDILTESYALFKFQFEPIV